MTALPHRRVDAASHASGTSADEDAERLRMLGDAATRLAGSLPVVPRRMTLRAGACAIELDLTGPEPAPEPGPAGPALAVSGTSLAPGLLAGADGRLTTARLAAPSGVAANGASPPGAGSARPATGSANLAAGATSPAPAVPGTMLVRAPLVGTFFVAPAPGADPFVTVGEHVVAGQQLAIVEAMKLMNPLTAECAGRVVEVLVGNGESVEYDQPLLVIAPEEEA